MIVVDFEFNQGATGREKAAKRLPFEIIEIGAVRLDEECVPAGEFTRLIRPQVFKRLHRYTKQLMRLEEGELEKGVPFTQAAEEFFAWCGDDRLFVTWGSDDLTELQRNLAFYGLPPLDEKPFPFFDAQKLFALAFLEDKKSRISLEHAVDALAADKEIPFHSALSDAVYTARILRRVAEADKENRGVSFFSYHSYDTFRLPAGKKEEIRFFFGDYTKYISRGFKSRRQLIDNGEVKSVRCYLCERNVKRKLPWFSLNGKHYYALGVCPTHGYVKAKLRVRKHRDLLTERTLYYADKTTKLISGEAAKKLFAMHERKLEQELALASPFT